MEPNSDLQSERLTKMSSPIFKLEEQLSDQRSEQIAYKLSIENDGDNPIRLISVEPRIPHGASLLEVIDTSIAEASAKKAELHEDLNNILQHFLFVSSESFRAIWVEQQRESVKKIFSFTGILYAYIHLFFNFAGFQARIKRDFESFSYKITSASDARSAYTRWFEKTEEFDTIRTLFEAKLEQLERIEELMGEGEKSSLAIIEGKSYFSATYVIRFSRGLLEPRKYQVGFDASYQAADASSALSVSTGTNVQISPFPFSLSLVTIFSAILGVLIKISLAGSQNPFSDMVDMAKSGNLIIGPIVALIFFNVYEYTSIGKGIGMSISWRSALLTGALCGIAQDRVLASLKALIGIGA